MAKRGLSKTVDTGVKLKVKRILTTTTVKKLLRSKDNWIKTDFAQDAKGRKVHWTSERAVKFSLAGAIFRAYCTEPIYEGIVLYNIVTPVYVKVDQYLGMDVSVWNDKPQRTFKDIQKLLKDLNI